jgi:predicted transcriptional regulator
MTIEECKLETIKHIENVRYFIKIITDKLTNRGINHDKCKLESPEVEIFTEYTPKLAELEYGSEQYKACLQEMQKALDHHYANCRHHPEHFDKGIDDMNIVDIVEMLCDWKAASMRQMNGNLLKSIETNAQRFGCDDQLKHIFINTAKLFEIHE